MLNKYTFIADIIKEQMQSNVIRLCISISKPSVFNYYLPLDLPAHAAMQSQNCMYSITWRLSQSAGILLLGV
jgi:hypothetical protein